MDKITVVTNWDLEDKESLKKIITCSSPEKKEFDIESVSTNSCVCLNKPNSSILDLAPEIEFESINLIQQIDLLSEGNLIEVFGKEDEYLGSCASEFVDDWDGMAVYHAKIPVPKISKCKLKVKRMKNSNRLWIYNAQITTLASEQTQKNIFNFDNVNQLLDSSNQLISEKAEKFKNFLELCVKNSTQPNKLTNSTPELHTMFNLINTDQISKFHDSSKSLIVQENQSETNTTSGGSTGSITVVEKEENSSGPEDLKTYIDSRLNDVKNEILEGIEVKLNKSQEETNILLNTIIKLLQTIKT